MVKPTIPTRRMISSNILSKICCSSTKLHAATQHLLCTGNGETWSFEILKNSQDMCDTISVSKEVAKVGEVFLFSVYGADNPHTLGKYRFMYTRELLQRCRLNLGFSSPHCHQQVLQPFAFVGGVLACIIVLKNMFYIFFIGYLSYIFH